MPSRPPPIHEELREAWLASGITLQEVVERSGVEFSADSLSRKLAGKQVLYADEARAIARGLDHTLNLAPRPRRAA